MICMLGTQTPRTNAGEGGTCWLWALAFHSGHVDQAVLLHFTNNAIAMQGTGGQLQVPEG